ncbi:tetratricopeptide repeat protein [Pyxidicoccus sp. 3LG]
MDKQTSLDRARELADSGAFGDAHRLLLQVLTLDPDDEAVLWTIVSVYEKQGTPAPVARYRARIAELYASQGRVEDALKLLRLAVEHHQDPPRIRKRIAELQEQTGQSDEARRQRWLAGEDVTLDETPSIEMLEQRVRARGFDDPLRVQLAEALLQAGRVRDAVPHFRQAIQTWLFTEDTRTSDERVVKPAPGYTHPILKLTRAEVREVRDTYHRLTAQEVEQGLVQARRRAPVWTGAGRPPTMKFFFDVERVLARLSREVRDNFDTWALEQLDALKQPELPDGAEVELGLTEVGAAEYLSKTGTGLYCPDCFAPHHGEVRTVTWQPDLPPGVITVFNETHYGESGHVSVYCPEGHRLFHVRRWIA